MFTRGSRLRPRRPSPAMLVACLALFVALSGGAYAAVVLPGNSVGSRQLQAGAVGFRNLANGAVGTRDLANNSVTYAKIARGEIGHARVAQSQIQWRVYGKCSGAFAVSSLTATGGVTCTSTLPTDYSTGGLTEPLTSSSNGTVLAAEPIPAGTGYQVTASPYIEVRDPNSGSDDVTVTCELAVGTSTQTRTVSLTLGTANAQGAASIPLSVDLPASNATAQAAVACTRAYSGATAPTVQTSSGIDATQVAGFTTTTTPGTSSSPVTLTTPTSTTTTTTTTP